MKLAVNACINESKKRQRARKTAPQAVEGEDRAEKPEKVKTAKLVVVGDSDFANNRYALAMFNKDFFVNCASWLIGEEAQITIRPRSYAPSLFQMTREEQALVFYLSVFIIPQLLLMIGIAVMIRRK